MDEIVFHASTYSVTESNDFEITKLLKHAADVKNLCYHDILFIKDIAKTIAKLQSDTKVKLQYIMEAIGYV